MADAIQHWGLSTNCNGDNVAHKRLQYDLATDPSRPPMTRDSAGKLAVQQYGTANGQNGQIYPGHKSPLICATKGYALQRQNHGHTQKQDMTMRILLFEMRNEEKGMSCALLNRDIYRKTMLTSFRPHLFEQRNHLSFV